MDFLPQIFRRYYLLPFLLLCMNGCSQPDCQNGGTADRGDCDCPFNTSGTLCSVARPSGMEINSFRLIQQPDIINDFGTRQNESYQFIFEIRHRNHATQATVALSSNDDAPFLVDFSPSEVYLGDRVYAGSSSRFLRDYGFQFSIRAEYTHSQGGYKGTFYNEPIPLEDMYSEGEDSFTFRVLEEVDDATVPLEFELRGEWLYD